MKIVKNKGNLITLLVYKKRANTKIELDVMLQLIDDFSRDFNIFNKLLECMDNIKDNILLESLLIDLDKE